MFALEGRLTPVLLQLRALIWRNANICLKRTVMVSIEQTCKKRQGLHKPRCVLSYSVLGRHAKCRVCVSSNLESHAESGQRYFTHYWNSRFSSARCLYPLSVCSNRKYCISQTITRSKTAQDGVQSRCKYSTRHKGWLSNAF